MLKKMMMMMKQETNAFGNLVQTLLCKPSRSGVLPRPDKFSLLTRESAASRPLALPFHCSAQLQHSSIALWSARERKGVATCTATLRASLV